MSNFCTAAMSTPTASASTICATAARAARARSGHHRAGHHQSGDHLGLRGRALGESFDTTSWMCAAGACPRPARRTMAWSQAADVLAFAQALGLEQYSLVGHSMGAHRRARRAEQAGRPAALVWPTRGVGPGRRPYPAKLPWYVDSMAQARQGMDADRRAFCPAGPMRSASCRASGCIPATSAPSSRASMTSITTTSMRTAAAGRGGPADHGGTRRRGAGRRRGRDPAAGASTRHHGARRRHMIPWDNEEGFYAAFGDFLARRWLA